MAAVWESSQRHARVQQHLLVPAKAARSILVATAGSLEELLLLSRRGRGHQPRLDQMGQDASASVRRLASNSSPTATSTSSIAWVAGAR
jgi:hypothetical protein